MYHPKSPVNLIVSIALTLCAYGTASAQFFNGANNTTGDIDRTGKVSIGSSAFPTGLQFLVTNGNIGQRQSTGVTFGGTNQGDLWTAIGGNPGVPNLPGLYGLKHQWGQYAINFQLQSRSTTNPDTQIKDAVIAWNSSNGSAFGNGNLRIGNIDASNNFIPRMTFLDNGNIGIGTTSPGEKFKIETSSSSLLDPIVRIKKTNFSTVDGNLNYILTIDRLEDNLPLLRFGAKRVSGFITQSVISGIRDVLISANTDDVNSSSISLGDARVTISSPTFSSTPGTILLSAPTIRLEGSLTTLNSSGFITSTSVQGGLVPTVNNAYSLGNSTFRWSSVFAANGVIQTSDRREKDNIKKLDYGLAHINKLSPVTYTWKERPEEGVVVGLIAQDVKKILPEVVYDPATALQKDAEGKITKGDPNAPMGIRYSDLIPVLINAIKELNQIVEEQDKTISQIKSEINTSSDLVGGSLMASTKQLTVYQNIPNPSTQSTTINYFVPESIQSAKLIIFNMNGEQKANQTLNNRGEGSVTISRSDLAPGMYFYVLIGDGQATNTMRMILSN